MLAGLSMVGFGLKENILMICGFGLATATESAVSLSIIIGSPIAKLMVCGRNILCPRMHASLASICLNTICCARGLDGYNAIVPIMASGAQGPPGQPQAAVVAVPECPAALFAGRSDFAVLCVKNMGAGNLTSASFSRHIRLQKLTILSYTT